MNNRAWLDPKESELLAEYAEKITGHIVEIGTFRGGTTELFARLVKPGYTVFSIDRYNVENLKHFIDYNPVVIYNQYLEPYQNSILIVADSRLVAKIWMRPIGLLFIDAAHDYDSVSKDFYGFSKFVVFDGYVALHDYGKEPGVIKLVNELVISEKWRIVEKHGLMVIIERVKPGE